MERGGVLPTTQFAYRKGLCRRDALLCVSHTLQSALESGQEARSMQIDYSAAFDSVNHLGILYKLCGYWRFCLVYIDTVSTQIDHSTLWWMVVGVNWLMLYQECAGQCFGPIIVPPLHFGAFFHFIK